MTCRACGSANRPGAKFCAECGAALAAACPGCGAPVEAAAKFCAECGTRLGPGVVTGRSGEDEQAELMETLDQSPGLPSWAADDPQLWHAIVTGDNEQVRDLGLAMARDDPLNAPALYERAAIGAGRLGDLAALDVVVAEFDALGRQGRTMAATRAFIAALCTGADPSAERAARSAVFRAAATAWRELECHFTVAMVQLEATRVLGPVTSEGREASAEARRIFDQLGAVPFLAQLDAFEAPIRA